ncbi:MAG: DUF1801 domain-containing protein [Methyloligellaceae bacterium]
MTVPAITDSDVQAVFYGHDPKVRETLRELRKVVFRAADATPGVGALQETLKWGQISYLPRKPRVGTTVRIDRPALPDARASLFFHCQTTLLETFRERYPDSFTYVDNRSVQLDADWALHEAELQHCLGLALSYHLWKVSSPPLVERDETPYIGGKQTSESHA